MEITLDALGKRLDLEVFGDGTRVVRAVSSPDDARADVLCVVWDERLRLPDADAERINVPANPRHYWRYRMHLCIEDLMADEAFMESVRELVYQSGR